MFDAVVVQDMPTYGTFHTRLEMPIDASNTDFDLDRSVNEIVQGVGEAEGCMVVDADVVRV
jgi:hypothetical protein